MELTPNHDGNLGKMNIPHSTLTHRLKPLAHIDQCLCIFGSQHRFKVNTNDLTRILFVDSGFKLHSRLICKSNIIKADFFGTKPTQKVINFRENTSLPHWRIWFWSGINAKEFLCGLGTLGHNQYWRIQFFGSCHRKNAGGHFEQKVDMGSHLSQVASLW